MFKNSSDPVKTGDLLCEDFLILHADSQQFLCVIWKQSVRFASVGDVTFPCSGLIMLISTAG